MLDFGWMDSGRCVRSAMALVLGIVPLAGAPAPQIPKAKPASSQVMAPAGRPQQRSFLGVGVQEVDSERSAEKNLPEERGVEITKVVPDSAADEAGIKKGDVVLEYNGRRVEGVDQFIRLVKETPTGRKVVLQVHRDGEVRTLTATIGTCDHCGALVLGRFPEVRVPPFNLPDVPRVFTTWNSSRLGIEAEALQPQLAEFFGVEKGVLVRSVAKNSPAEKAGFRAGDVIVRVGGATVTNPREVTSAIRDQRSDTFKVLVIRDRKETSLTIEMEGADTGGNGRLRRNFADDGATSL